ncbi:MAG: hypothetical protein Ct9H300mP23_02780 [Nitrospinota bacterium]|nr:MAG: hypothetical protein Ct9H300mP23_02780 [Nitrospinota bacterium]
MAELGPTPLRTTVHTPGVPKKIDAGKELSLKINALSVMVVRVEEMVTRP